MKSRQTIPELGYAVDNHRESLTKLFFRRHSIRKYKEEAVAPEAVKQILEAGLLAPSSKSARPWQFTVVEDREVLEAMSKCKPAGARPIAGAAFAVVVSADPAKSDVFIEDVSVAAAYMQLQAAALGIGSCWIQIRNRFGADDEPSENMIHDLLDIPYTQSIVTVLTFGVPDEERREVDPSKLLWEKVHIGKWNAGE